MNFSAGEAKYGFFDENNFTEMKGLFRFIFKKASRNILPRFSQMGICKISGFPTTGCAC
jgi:hypothetical protein